MIMRVGFFTLFPTERLLEWKREKISSFRQKKQAPPTAKATDEARTNEAEQSRGGQLSPLRLFLLLRLYHLLPSFFFLYVYCKRLH